MGLFQWYRKIIPLYFKVIRWAASFHHGARAWVEGRSNWETKLKAFNEWNKDDSRFRIWMHASSLGEFEQGRELLERIREQHPEYVILLSFFSPSGYSKRKDYPHADLVCYFPSDSPQEVRLFLDLIQADFVIFIKYDFWFECLDQLSKRQIPYIYVSSYFRPGHYLLKPLSRSFLDILMKARQIFLQDQDSYKLLYEKGFRNISVTGDSRLDRVAHVAREGRSFPELDAFCGTKDIFIAGSIWDTDFEVIEAAVSELIRSGWKAILVPHKPDSEHIRQLESLFPDLCQRFSSFEAENEKPILIIDEVGMLSSLYRYGKFAYIGGGFGKGIHNILEPAAHGIPVCFGPKFKKFPEAVVFIKLGIGSPVRSKKDIITLLHAMKPQDFERIKLRIQEYFQKNEGASEKIYDYLTQQGLLR